MSFEADPFEIRVSARRFTGWTSMGLSSGIEAAQSTMQVKLIGVYQDTDEQVTAGDLVSAFVGGERLFSGYADIFEDGTSASSESLSIECRSRTVDIIESDALPKTYKGIRFDRFVQELVADFALEVVFEDAAVAAQVIRVCKVAVGSKVFDEIDKQARDLGCLVTDDAAGRLVVTKAGAAGKSSTRLVRGRNCFETSGRWDMTQRYSHVEVKGQVATDLDVDVAATGGARDPGVLRYRRLVIAPDKGLDRQGAIERARWEVVSRAGKSVGVQVTVGGWRQEDGSLWRPNQLVRYTDARKRMVDAELLVTQRTFTLSNTDARKTVLTLAPLAGFKPYVAGKPVLSGAGGRWFSLASGEQTTRPTQAEIDRAEGR